MNANLTQPSVKLIDISDNRDKAWMFSRPGFDHSQLNMEEIGSMDMGLNSLCMLTFEIHSSILFRDFLFSVRPIFPWARSSRSAPLTKDNCSISAEFEGAGWSKIIKTLEKIESGVPQDQARENLPMTMSTAYTVTMDFRTVCGLIKTMYILDKELFETYGNLFEKQIDHIAGYKSNTVKSFHENYLIKDNELKTSGVSRAGEMIMGSYEMKYPLASQFLRQAHSQVKTFIWNYIQESGYFNLWAEDQMDTVPVVYYTSKSAYHNLMQLRSHWFADWSNDMWGNIVGDYVKHMTAEEFWEFIPNGNGKIDPYFRDMISRVNGEEHNLPCPIMLEYPELVIQRLHRHGNNKVIMKYAELVSRGYIKNNPNNALRIQYLNNQGAKHENK